MHCIQHTSTRSWRESLCYICSAWLLKEDPWFSDQDSHLANSNLWTLLIELWFTVTLPQPVSCGCCFNHIVLICLYSVPVFGNNDWSYISCCHLCEPQLGNSMTCRSCAEQCLTLWNTRGKIRTSQTSLMSCTRAGWRTVYSVFRYLNNDHILADILYMLIVVNWLKCWW